MKRFLAVEGHQKMTTESLIFWEKRVVIVALLHPARACLEAGFIAGDFLDGVVLGEGGFKGSYDGLLFRKKDLKGTLLPNEERLHFARHGICCVNTISNVQKSNARVRGKPLYCG